MLHWVLESCGNVSLTFVVAHGFLCHQLDAAPSHHIMELGQEQEPVGAKGTAEKDGRLGKAGRLGQPQRRLGEVSRWQKMCQPPEILQQGSRVEELGTAGQGQAAEQLHVVQDPLTLPVPLLDLSPREGDSV